MGSALPRGFSMALAVGRHSDTHWGQREGTPKPPEEGKEKQKWLLSVLF